MESQISEDPNPKKIKNFANSFLLLLIGIAILTSIIFLILLLIPTPIEPPTDITNNSLFKQITGLNSPLPIIYNNSIEPENVVLNTTVPLNATISEINNNSIQDVSVLDKINGAFSSSNVSTISESYSVKGGFVDLIVNNFAIFLTILGAFSLFCFFYFNITYNANVISEYSEEQQKNQIVFFQIAIISLILILFYAISLFIFHLKFQFFELVVVGLFFVMDVFTANLFGEYSLLIRPNYENMAQFAAVRDLFSYKGKDFFSVLTDFISILSFILIFLVVIFGIISNFTIFSIFFSITLLLIMIWEINIIDKEPRSIFNVKIRNCDTIFQGFILSKLDKPTIQLFVNDHNHKNKILQIPRTSIEYIVLNRKIDKHELITQSVSPFDTLKSIWASLTPVKNFLISLFGFTFGFVVGIFLFFWIGIFITDFGFPPQWLIGISLIFALVFGFIISRAFQSFHKQQETIEEWQQYDEMMEEDLK